MGGVPVLVQAISEQSDWDANLVHEFSTKAGQDCVGDFEAFLVAASCPAWHSMRKWATAIVTLCWARLPSWVEESCIEQGNKFCKQDGSKGGRAVSS